LQEDLSDKIPYSLRLYQLSLKDEGNGIWSTTLFENVHSVPIGSELSFKEDFDHVFYSFTFDKKLG
jgi:hypothetical protein